MQPKSMKLKIYEKRFGTIAVEKGFIGKTDLTLALEIQAIENIEEKRHRLIGEILFYEDLITHRQIEEVVKELLKKTTDETISEQC